MLKKILYEQAKLIAENQGLPHPVYIGSSIQSLTRFIRTVRPKLPYLNEITNNIKNITTFRFTRADAHKTPEQLKEKIFSLLKDGNNFFIFLNEDNKPITIRKKIVINKNTGRNSKYRPYFNLHLLLSKLLDNHEEYQIRPDYIIIQIHQQITISPPLRNQRNGDFNCACKVVIDHLNNHKSERNKYIIKHINKINEEYFKTGINDEGLKKLADKSRMTLIIKDKIGEIWREFKPNGKDTKQKKLMLLSHNNHISEIYDEDDTMTGTVNIQDYNDSIDIPIDFEKQFTTPDTILPDDIEWFDTTQDLIDRVVIYEEKEEGKPIISKGELIAYITKNTILKTKFHQYEQYPQCFTNGSVGKEKFKEELIKQNMKHLYDGITQEDPFYNLLMDADLSGFYCRTKPSDDKHFKYDQNKAYKSFSKSKIFNGFPILEAIFKVNKPFSEFLTHESLNGLLYIEYDTLTANKLNKKLYYECSGWYPVEIVKYFYENDNINPFVKSYAYASETFNINFNEFTNQQFRSFIGKCVSKTYEECWMTKDYLEFMRARYILQDRIVSFRYNEGFYQISYESDKPPWNMPVISVYVKAHQKFNLFNQYNKLIDNNITPICVSVDGIEVDNTKSEKLLDSLFDLGVKNGQWKKEKIHLSPITDPYVIEREIHEPLQYGGEVEFNKDLLLNKFQHFSGAGGNGKSQKIIEVAKYYKGLLYMGPTNDAVKNLIDRAEEMNIKIEAHTYHKVFGFGCADMFPRSKYQRFILDECSMLSSDNLKIIMKKLKKNQSLILAGDFYQLPCLSPETPIYDNWTHKKSKYYEKFKVVELTKNWRQKEDPEFFNLCQTLRNKLTKEEAEEIIKKLNTRVVSNLPENTTTDDIHICGINNQVDNINKNYKLEVNCKVICNTTCRDLDKQLMPNGSIGIITEMQRGSFKIEMNGKSYRFKGVGKNTSGKSRFTPAYGLTIHKAQGKTIKRNVIINPTRLFSKNHLYVALTRATKFNSIFLTHPITFDVFKKTVNVMRTEEPRISTTRFGRMLNTYLKEEPRLTLQYLQSMRDEQKNKCKHCGISMCDEFGYPNSITLERINDAGLHTLDNVVLYCFSCNSNHIKLKEKPTL